MTLLTFDSTGTIKIVEKKQKRKANMNDNEFNINLIENVQSYPILWDSKHPQHKDNNALRKAWLEIANEMKTTDVIVKTRWRTLRDRYRKEVLKSKWTSGQGTSQIHKWPLFSSLEFLRPTVQPRQVIPGDGILEVSRTDSNFQPVEDLTQVTFDDAMDSNGEEITTFVEYPNTEETEQTETVSNKAPSASSSRRAKRKATAEPDQSDEVEEAILKHLKVPPPEQTAEELFYASIAKQVASLTPRGRLNVQMAVLQAISIEMKNELE